MSEVHIVFLRIRANRRRNEHFIPICAKNYKNARLIFTQKIQIYVINKKLNEDLSERALKAVTTRKQSKINSYLNLAKLDNVIKIGLEPKL